MEKHITNEFLLRYGINAPVVTLDVLQGSLAAQVTMAYNLLCDLLETEKFFLQVDVLVVDLLSHNIRAEAYRMLVANYLVSLIGTGKNDKNSIYKDAYKTDYGKKFYDNNANEITNLKAIRDTIYSHADIDAENKTQTMPMSFIKKAILFVCKFLNIDSPPTYPKDSDKYFYLGYNDFMQKYHSEHHAE